jgi:hypothetical protein
MHALFCSWKPILVESMLILFYFVSKKLYQTIVISALYHKATANTILKIQSNSFHYIILIFDDSNRAFQGIKVHNGIVFEY